LTSEFLEYFDFYIDPKNTKIQNKISFEYKERLKNIFIRDVTSSVSIEGIKAFSFLEKFPFNFRSILIEPLKAFYSKEEAR